MTRSGDWGNELRSAELLTSMAANTMAANTLPGFKRGDNGRLGPRHAEPLCRPTRRTPSSRRCRPWCVDPVKDCGPTEEEEEEEEKEEVTPTTTTSGRMRLHAASPARPGSLAASRTRQPVPTVRYSLDRPPDLTTAQCAAPFWVLQHDAKHSTTGTAPPCRGDEICTTPSPAPFPLCARLR